MYTGNQSLGIDLVIKHIITSKHFLASCILWLKFKCISYKSFQIPNSSHLRMQRSIKRAPWKATQWWNLSQARQPQREALMGKWNISVSIWDDLNVITITSIFTKRFKSKTAHTLKDAEVSKTTPTKILDGETCHDRDNPKEKHLWTWESPVALFEVIWGGFSKQMVSNTFSCFCQLKLPQHVALTQFNSQVNAQVRVILLTYKNV